MFIGKNTVLEIELEIENRMSTVLIYFTWRLKAKYLAVKIGVGFRARPDSSAVEHLTYKFKGRELEPRSGRLFSGTLY